MARTDHDTREAPVLFLSDQHLDPKRPDITRLFLSFLAGEAREAQAVYILGDLFEAWIGDDAVDGSHPIIQGLATLSASGVPLSVMRGNRDFLLGERFAELTGATLLPDPWRISLDGEDALLLHGDSLCIDDVDYQRFREMVRDPEWQAQFLSLTIEQRLAKAAEARSESASRNGALDDYLMDVNAAEVERVMRQHNVRLMIHGHTHRPAVHDITIDGEPAQRIVLGDWYEQGSVLRARDGRLDLANLPLAGH